MLERGACEWMGQAVEETVGARQSLAGVVAGLGKVGGPMLVVLGQLHQRPDGTAPLKPPHALPQGQCMGPSAAAAYGPG